LSAKTVPPPTGTSEVEVSAVPEAADGAAGAADAGAGSGAAVGAGAVATEPPPQAVSSPAAATPPAPATTARLLRPGAGDSDAGDSGAAAGSGDVVWVMNFLAWWWERGAPFGTARPPASFTGELG
jgi:hypothetical protein